MNREIQDSIVELLKREVVPATGCTEPIAVALAAAKAKAILGCGYEDVDSAGCRLSANIIKNAMGVGIPGTGTTGLPIAVALGICGGDSSKGLEVIAHTSTSDLEHAREILKKNIISINLEENPTDILYIDVILRSGAESARVLISGNHSHFTGLWHNLRPLPVETSTEKSSSERPEPELTLQTVWEFTTGVALDKIEFIAEAGRLNKAAGACAYKYRYGHGIGQLLRKESQRNILGNSIFTHILSETASACDARMGGAPVAVMSNSGSGNQGIAATMPVVVYAEDTGASTERTIRALTLSHLTAIYIKKHLGRLSALCGCVVATTGSSAGICYLMGGGYDAVAMAVKNMVANLTGMICDGAKPGCALKLTSGVSTAVISAMLAMEQECANELEGIIDSDVDRTIRNFAAIGRDGMKETDNLILKIMTSK